MNDVIASLVAAIRRHPCGRCDPNETKERCATYSKSCLELYTAEALDVYSDIVRPLELRLKAAEKHISQLEGTLAQVAQQFTKPALIANPPSTYKLEAAENRAHRLELALKTACERLNTPCETFLPTINSQDYSCASSALNAERNRAECLKSALGKTKKHTNQAN